MSVYKRISLYLRNAGTGKANVYGNNAGWACPCGEPLVGRAHDTFKYVCYCGLSYQVLSREGPLHRPDEVREVTS